MDKQSLCLQRESRLVAMSIVFAALLGGARAWSQEPAADLSGQRFITQHSGVFNGEQVDYTATVADLVIRDGDGRPTASIYGTSYVRNDVADSSSRPVIFIWNGGPSAASQTLHMAGFGPMRLFIPADVSAPIEPPYSVQANRHTVLDVADLVFVDPVETGFSRILPAGDPAYFYSVDGDAESVAGYIRAWAAANGRDSSPLYALGTSYGSIRTALVAKFMAEAGMPLDGALLFSQGVNLVETTQRKNSIVGYASNVSQLAAIAWFHGRSAMQRRPVAEVIEVAQSFAMGDYLVALAAGSSLPEDKQRATAERLAALTGIGAAYYLEHGLVITKARFRQELLREEGLVLGSNDARYTAPADAEQRPASPTAGVADVHRMHMHEFLGVTANNDEYRAFAPIEFGDWDWSGTTTLGYRKSPPGTRSHIFADFDYPGEIVAAFEANERFRLFIATGYYDTLTTVGPARLLASDTDYPADRVTMHDYPGGHSFYSNEAAFESLANDVRAFVTAR